MVCWFFDMKQKMTQNKKPKKNFILFWNPYDVNLSEWLDIHSIIYSIVTTPVHIDNACPIVLPHNNIATK